MKKDVLKEALIKASPIITSYMFLSIAYGILMEEIGAPWYFSMLTSFIVYTGAFQYVLITFIAACTPLITVITTALFMNSRQVFYSLTYLEEFKKTGKRLPLMIHLLTDETYAVYSTIDKDDPNRKDLLLWVGIFSWLSWVFGTVIGALAGTLLPFTLEGIDFCMTALFVIIFVDQWEKAEKHFAALSGFVISGICLAIFGASKFMLPSLLITSVVLLVYNHSDEKKIVKEDEEK